jgi:hypothetical protein
VNPRSGTIGDCAVGLSDNCSQRHTRVGDYRSSDKNGRRRDGPHKQAGNLFAFRQRHHNDKRQKKKRLERYSDTHQPSGPLPATI